MTVQANLPPTNTNSDGTTVTFGYDFKVQRIEHLKATQTVIATGVVSELEIESATGINNDGGGTVTFAAAPPDNCIITIDSVAPLSQVEQFNGNKLPPESVERMGDAIAIQNQRQQSQIERSVRFPASDEQIPTLPAQAQRADKLIGFSADGSEFVMVSGAAASQAYVDLAKAEADRAVKAADYPYTRAETKTAAFMPVDADSLTLYRADSTGGAITVTLDEIANLSAGWNIGIYRASGGEDVTIQCSNGDLIDGVSSVVINSDYQLLDITHDGSEFIAVIKCIAGLPIGTDPYNIVALDENGKLPAVDGSNLTGLDLAANQKTDILTPAFKKTTAQTISIKAGTRIAAGGIVHYWASDTAVTMPTHSAGSDYSIWLKTDGSLEAVADSFGSPATTGDLTSPQAGAVKVGGYHYGLVNPSETVAGGGFSTSGVTSTGGSFGWTQTDVDKIKGINEFSIWDDTFKCAGEQRGMAFDPIMKMWAAIYFMSDNPDTNGPSAYNTNVGSGTVLPYIPSAWGGDGSTKYSRLATFEANELVSAFGLRLPRYEEFMSFAFGVTEEQSLGGASSTITATARQAGYTSRIGIEQATGHQYAIGGPIHSVGGSAFSGVGRGSIYAGAGQILLGGYRLGGSGSGSRCVYFLNALSNSDWVISVRAVGDHLNLGQKVR